MVTNYVGDILQYLRLCCTLTKCMLFFYVKNSTKPGRSEFPFVVNLRTVRNVNNYKNTVTYIVS